MTFIYNSASLNCLIFLFSVIGIQFLLYWTEYSKFWKWSTKVFSFLLGYNGQRPGFGSAGLECRSRSGKIMLIHPTGSGSTTLRSPKHIRIQIKGQGIPSALQIGISIRNLRASRYRTLWPCCPLVRTTRQDPARPSSSLSRPFWPSLPKNYKY